ncbi:Serine/threonine phosphatase stp [Tepidimonas alkaliphilus]|uniref:Serine/threonine phosphatase stp n=1 Tax=Tepidimonas alkaliphilus TaxID=2588942 RepID=A0A554WBB4_9BURK|nr:protein phosphatase 2C domain-containing protein [Tepidimonas alkaliphilus]TSE20867.1 Serine/threonine phosphatase stp [Tepidimonas alkaliphilus]
MPAQPASRSLWCFASACEAGPGRDHCEDVIRLDAELGLAVVADGVGGYQAGEVAARICCETLHAALAPTHREAHNPPDPQRLQVAVHAAHQAVLQRAWLDPTLRGMATTVVAVWLAPDRAVVAHVGDSRAYRLRQGQLTLLTRDHSRVQEALDAGRLTPQQARVWPHRHEITRAIGVGLRVDIEIGRCDLQPGDTVLLCSDGLTDALPDETLARLLRETGPLDQTIQQLVRAARQAGGSDDIAVVLAQRRPAPC